MSTPAYKIAERLDPRTAYVSFGDHWQGLVYTATGTRVVECEHHHRKERWAKRCAERLLAIKARLESARGAGLPK